MSKVTVMCDECGTLLDAATAFYDVGSEHDLCELHWTKLKLDQKERARCAKQKWLEETHLREIDRMSAEIDELRAKLETLIKVKE